MKLKRGNIFTPVQKSDDEFTEILAQSSSGGVRVERIISDGHVSPENFWYDQDEWEYVAVLQGGAELEFSSHEIITMNAGDWVLIPEHERHRVNQTSSPCVWLAVFGS